MTFPVPLTRKPKALGIETHRAGEFVYCSVCRLDRARRSKAARVHRAVRERRALHRTLEALR